MTLITEESTAVVYVFLIPESAPSFILLFLLRIERWLRLDSSLGLFPSLFFCLVLKLAGVTLLNFSSSDDSPNSQSTSFNIVFVFDSKFYVLVLFIYYYWLKPENNAAPPATIFVLLFACEIFDVGNNDLPFYIIFLI
jgi:hypothetical protein